MLNHQIGTLFFMSCLDGYEIFLFLFYNFFRKLSISLPRTVDSEIGKAKWDATNCILIVSLPIDRSHAFF